MSLFDTDAGGNVVTAAGRPSREVVSLLEGFGYRAEKVKQWSAVKANAVLESCRKEAAIVARRATATAAGQEDEKPARGQPTGPERWQAAAVLDLAAKEGLDELHLAVTYTVYCLTDDELRRVAGYLGRLFRGQE